MLVRSRALQEEFPDISANMRERGRKLQAERYFHQSHGAELFRIEEELNLSCGPGLQFNT